MGWTSVEETLLESVLQIVEHHGYIALYTLLALGIVGLPIPDETLLVFVGVLTAKRLLGYSLAVAVAFAGSMSGMLISYTIGRRLGKPFLHRFGGYVRLTPNRLERAETWFRKYGIWSVTFGYFVPGIRHFTCYLAGVSAIRLSRYVLFAGIGALIWCVTFISIGHYFGANWEWIVELLHKMMAKLALSALIIGVLALIGVLLYRKRSN